MKKLRDMMDIFAASGLMSAAVCCFAETGNWLWMAEIPVVLWLLWRIWAAQRQTNRMEEEKEVWKTMYEMKSEELLAAAEKISRCQCEEE